MYNYTVKTLVDFTLGDGSILYRSEKHRLPYFSVTHCKKQHEYAVHKHDILKELGVTVKWIVLKNSEKTYVSAYQSEDASTARKYLYNTGRKAIDKKVLSIMDLRSFAFLFFDDGGAHVKKRKKIGRFDYHYESPFIDGFSIATCSFSLDENKLLSDWIFSEFGIKNRVNILKKKYPRIVIDTRDAKEKLVSILKPFVIPCLAYKFMYPITTQGMCFEKFLYGERLNESGATA